MPPKKYWMVEKDANKHMNVRKQLHVTSTKSIKNTFNHNPTD